MRRTKTTISGLLAAALLFAATACQPALQEDAGSELQALVESYLQWRLVEYPGWATAMGNHDHDAEMTDMSADAFARREEKTQEFKAKLEAIDPAALSLEDQVDREILLNQLDYEHFRYAELQSWKRDPLLYTSQASDSVYNLIKRNFAPLEDRLRSAVARMKAVPALLEQARANLDAPPRIRTEIAISQAEGAIGLFREVMVGAAEGTAIAGEVAEAGEVAAAAIEQYRDWLRDDLLPRSVEQWQLGPELYDRLFALEIGGSHTPEEVLARAEADFETTLEELRSLAVENWSTYVPDKPLPDDPDDAVRGVVEAMGDDHPEPDDFIPALRRAAENLKQFIREKDILDLPDPDRLSIVPTPDFQAGIFHGDLDQPPPLQPGGESVYSTSGSRPYPGPNGQERLIGFLREFNSTALVNLILHEGYPGHYVQGYYAGLCPSLVRKVFVDGTYAEGWACYCEEMMLEEGFGNPGLRMQTLKMRLKMITNAIIDISLHRGTMAEDEVVPMLIERAFQTPGEAQAKLVRAKGTAVQLSTYYVGFAEMWEIRNDYEAAKGDDFDLKQFHHAVLYAGGPQMHLLRKLVIREQ